MKYIIKLTKSELEFVFHVLVHHSGKSPKEEKMIDKIGRKIINSYQKKELE